MTTDSTYGDHNNNLFYGLHNEELKHITEVENGLKCDCICPACKKRLIARNAGEKRRPHFAHHESAACKYGPQTSIHIAAKNIFEKIGKIKLPPISVFITNRKVGAISRGNVKEDTQINSNAIYVPIDNVVLEKKLHNYIPDIVISSGKKRLIVEIAVTHFVGRKKIEKIKTSNISAIEIDLSRIDLDFNMADLEKLLIEGIENKAWLYNHYLHEQNSRHKSEEIMPVKVKSLSPSEKRLEKFYKKYYKPVILRGGALSYYGQVIENCPLKKGEHNNLSYANVKTDCKNCFYSRWLRDNHKYLVCVYEYHHQIRK